MLARIPVLGQRLVSTMTDRVREATRVMQQREKMTALGTLAAGLAHELNNPAAAVRRDAEALETRLGGLADLAADLCATGLDGPSLRALGTLAESLRQRPAPTLRRAGPQPMRRRRGRVARRARRGRRVGAGRRAGRRGRHRRRPGIGGPAGAGRGGARRRALDRDAGGRDAPGARHPRCLGAHLRAGAVGEGLLAHGSRGRQGSGRLARRPGQHAGDAWPQAEEEEPAARTRVRRRTCRRSRRIPAS